MATDRTAATVVVERAQTAAPRERRGRVRWCRGTWLVLSASVAWLAFVVAHLAFSGRVWWWTVLELLPPIGFVLVPVLLLAVAPLARPARGRIAVVLAGALLLGWEVSGVNAAALWHRPPPAPAGAVTIFSLNTWYWDQPAAQGRLHPPPGGTPASDRDAFYTYLRDQDADVYLLQEYLYFREDATPVRLTDRERIAAEFPDHHLAVLGEFVTLSRYPILSQDGMDMRARLTAGHGSLPPPDAQLPEYYTTKTLRTDIAVGGGVVSLYNVHIPPPTARQRALRLQYDLRRASIVTLADDVAGNPHPAVVAGDFNSSSASGVWHLLPDRLADAGPAVRSLYPATWHEQWPLRMWRIDWAFTTAELTVHEYALVDSGDISDHTGIRLSVSLTD